MLIEKEKKFFYTGKRVNQMSFSISPQSFFFPILFFWVKEANINGM